MAIRLIQPRRLKKVKTKNSQEVLRRLEAYLQNELDEPVEILCGFWKDQQDAITYQELRQAVRDGFISTETLELWQQDYSVLVTDKLSGLWKNAILAGPNSQPILDNVPFVFNTQTQGITNWIKSRGAALVTQCTEQQKDAISALLTKKMRDSHTVDELARMIRPCIGLTEGDARAATRLYDTIVQNLKTEHPRMKVESIRQKALDATQKYAERKHRARALTIAQTESAFAYNRGADEGIRQAQSEGWLGVMKKRWSTSGDDAVCALCSSLEGTEVGMDESYNITGRILFTGQHLLPPAHPRCACAIEYIEDQKNPAAKVVINEVKASDFTGDTRFEITQDANDLHLTQTAREKITEKLPNIKTASDLQNYLSSKGISMEVNSEALLTRMSDEIPAVKKQIDLIVSAMEQYEELGGLSSIKTVHFWDVDLETQGAYIYRALNEGFVENEGHIYISNRADGFQIMHEFAHAWADSTKPAGMDVVSWSAVLNSRAGLSKDATAYFGAAQEAIEAEKFADAIGGAIAYGDSGKDRLSFLANVANIILQNM